jgi:hypothetical protein
MRLKRFLGIDKIEDTNAGRDQGNGLLSFLLIPRDEADSPIRFPKDVSQKLGGLPFPNPKV